MMRKRSGTTTSDEVRSRHWGGSLARAAFNFFAWVVYRVAYHPPLAKYPRNLGLAARIALAFFGSAVSAFPRAAICFDPHGIEQHDEVGCAPRHRPSRVLLERRGVGGLGLAGADHGRELRFTTTTVGGE